MTFPPPHIKRLAQSLAARTGLYVNHSLQGDNAAALSTLKLSWQAYYFRHMTGTEQLKPLWSQKCG
jgi:L-aminopeptidase/D-esterase-like protein